jgi:hypothetical protein
LKLQLFAKAPETFWHFTDMPPVYTKLLGQKLGHAIGSLGSMGAAVRRNPVASAGVSAGEVVGKV